MGLVLLGGTNLRCAWADPAAEGNGAARDMEDKKSPLSPGKLSPVGRDRDLSLMPSLLQNSSSGTSSHTTLPEGLEDKCLST